MPVFWREAGLSYLQYSNIAAKALRQVLKEEARLQAVKREEQYLKGAKWVAGKQADNTVIDATGAQGL